MAGTSPAIRCRRSAFLLPFVCIGPSAQSNFLGHDKRRAVVSSEHAVGLGSAFADELLLFRSESQDLAELVGRLLQLHPHPFDVFLQVMERLDDLAVVSQRLSLAC